MGLQKGFFMAQTNYRDRIVRIRGVVGGKPVIKGTLISVELVLQYLVGDPHVESLFAAFPQLTMDDVRACLCYALELVEEEQAFPSVEEPPYQQAHV
jgi:uncharacterized protein (DUF433 family)